MNIRRSLAKRRCPASRRGRTCANESTVYAIVGRAMEAAPAPLTGQERAGDAMRNVLWKQHGEKQ